MGMATIIVTAIGLVVGLSVLLVSLRGERHPPVHRVLWIIAMIALGASIAFRLVLLVGISIAGGFAGAVPVLIGNLAVVGLFTAAFWRPSWSGWALIGTAVGLPIVGLLLELIIGAGEADGVAAAMLGFYSLPAIITGVLLVLSARERGDESE